MIHYVKGDATKPQGDGKKLLIHVVNDSGGWGAGFVLALSKRWKEPEQTYRSAWSFRRDKHSSFYLGAVQVVPVEADISVANMVAQRGYSRPGQPAVDYAALERCLKTVGFYFKSHPGTTVHGCRFGSGLAGGSWPEIEKLIEKHLSAFEVYIYDLEEK